MLSIGIRFGQGFDRPTILNIIQDIPMEYEYDLLVIGASPGGIALAREASAAGKKTAVLMWKHLTPAEEEGFDETYDDVQYSFNFDTKNEHEWPKKSYRSGEMKRSSMDKKKISGSKFSKSVSNRTRSGSTNSAFSSKSKKKWSKKVRLSRVDLTNEILKNSVEGRRLMHNASILRDTLRHAQKIGWRVPPVYENLSMNWTKMMDNIMEQMMEQNWKMMNDLALEKVEIIEGAVSFLDNHTVRVVSKDGDEKAFTSELICIAPSAKNDFPEDVEGARKYGINLDDFIRLQEPPGKTLIVGGGPEAMECAGILILCQFPVTVVSRSKLLKRNDSEISELILRNLKEKGVNFIEKTEVQSVGLNNINPTLSVKFLPLGSSADDNYYIEFDTVLFATTTSLNLKFLDMSKTGLTYDPQLFLLSTDEKDQTAVPNIYALGDVVLGRPKGHELSHRAGKLLGKRLFFEGKNIMEYSMFPVVILTPIEYAYVGISEDKAIYRFGAGCIDIIYGKLTPSEEGISSTSSPSLCKLIVLREKDTIIGIHVWGLNAGEIIQGYAAAVRFGMTMTQLRTLVGAPTTSARKIISLIDMRITAPYKTPSRLFYKTKQFAE